MATQTHTVFTDAISTLGTIIDESAARDAIHLAVEPVIAAERVFPGQDVGKLTDVGGNVGYGASDSPVGIVDPFLKRPVQVGQRFWLVVYPRQITSLRHVWEHPAFDAASAVPLPSKAAAEAWLRDFCSTADCPGYDVVMSALRGERPDGEDPDGYLGYYNFRIDSEYFHFGGYDAHGEIPMEFWRNAEIVLGTTLKYHPASFSCSC